MSDEKSPAERLDALFKDAGRANAPGLAVAVAHRGQLLYRKAFGMASIEHAAANTPRTRFRIASLSKQFTAFAALLLAARGSLDVDAPALRLLPELAALEGGDRVTLRQMMQHTSGLRDAADLYFIANGLGYVPNGLELLSLGRQRRLNFEPGQGQLYCNSSYWLLALAISRASGMTFERFMTEQVFEPLGMPDSASVPSDMMIVPGLATMHQALPDGSWRRALVQVDDYQGAGAMVSTVDDLLRWAALLRAADPAVAPPAVWQQLTEPALLAHGYRTEYACGLSCNRYRGEPVWQHGGSLIGVAAQFITVPRHELDVAILANCELHDVVGLSKKAIDAVLGDALPAQAPAATKSAGFERLLGRRWHAESGMTIGFDAVGDLLAMSLFHSPPIPAVEDRGTQIGLGGGGTGPFCFDRDALQAGDTGTPPASITMFDAGAALQLRRLPDAPPAATAIAGLWIGDYDAPELGATARIALEQGDTLVLHIVTSLGTRSATLEPLSDEVLGVTLRDPLFPARLVATRRGAAAFDLDGGRSRHLRFERRA